MLHRGPASASERNDAMCQSRLTHCSRPPTRSPRRCGQAASADFEAQRLASPEIDAQFDSGGLLDSQVGGLLASENPPGIDAALIDSTPPSHCRGSSSSRWPRRMCVMDSRTTLYIFADRAPLHQLAAIPVSFGGKAPTDRTPRASPAPSRTNWKNRQSPAAMHLPQPLHSLKNSLAILLF